MARIDKVFDEGTISKGVQAPIADLRYGAQMGYSPDLTTWVSNHPYVSRNVICILMEVPRIFTKMPNAERWIATFREFFERMPQSITGLQQSMQIDTDSVKVGKGGQEHEFFTNVQYSKPNLQFQMHERYNLGIFRFINNWIRMGMMDPDTGYASVNTVSGMEITDLLPDQYSCTALFIEPDPVHKFVVQSWLVTNIFPKDSIENTSQRSMTDGYQKRDLTISLTGLAQWGAGVDAMAQMIMNRMSLKGADPHHRQAFVKDIDALVKDRPFGYHHGIDTLAQQQINV